MADGSDQGAALTDSNLLDGPGMSTDDFGGSGDLNHDMTSPLAASPAPLHSTSSTMSMSSALMDFGDIPMVSSDNLDPGSLDGPSSSGSNNNSNNMNSSSTSNGNNQNNTANLNSSSTSTSADGAGNNGIDGGSNGENHRHLATNNTNSSAGPHGPSANNSTGGSSRPGGGDPGAPVAAPDQSANASSVASGGPGGSGPRSNAQTGSAAGGHNTSAPQQQQGAGTSSTSSGPSSLGNDASSQANSGPGGSQGQGDVEMKDSQSSSNYHQAGPHNSRQNSNPNSSGNNVNNNNNMNNNLSSSSSAADGGLNSSTPSAANPTATPGSTGGPLLSPTTPGSAAVPPSPAGLINKQHPFASPSPAPTPQPLAEISSSSSSNSGRASMKRAASSGLTGNAAKIHARASKRMGQTIEDHMVRIAPYCDYETMMAITIASKKCKDAVVSTKEWRMKAMTLVKDLKGHIGPINVLIKVSHFVFSGSADGKIKIWNSRTWACERTVNVSPLPNQPSQQQSLVPQGKQPKGGRVTDDSERTNAVTALTVLEKVLFIGLEDGYLIIRMIMDSKDTQRENKKIQAHEGAVKAIAVHARANKIFTGGADKKIKVWNSSTYELLSTFDKHTDMVTALEICNSYLFSGGRDSKLMVWSTSDPLKHEKQLERPESDRERRSFGIITALTSHENRVFSASWDCYIRVWDAEKLVLLNETFIWPVGVCWSLAVRVVKGYPTSLVCGIRDGDVEVRRIDSDEHMLDRLQSLEEDKWCTKLQKHEDWILCVLPLPDGRIVTGCEDWMVKVWDYRFGPESLRPPMNPQMRRPARPQPIPRMPGQPGQPHPRLGAQPVDYQSMHGVAGARPPMGGNYSGPRGPAGGHPGGPGPSPRGPMANKPAGYYGDSRGPGNYPAHGAGTGPPPPPTGYQQGMHPQASSPQGPRPPYAQNQGQYGHHPQQGSYPRPGPRPMYPQQAPGPNTQQLSQQQLQVNQRRMYQAPGAAGYAGQPPQGGQGYSSQGGYSQGYQQPTSASSQQQQPPSSQGF